MRRELVIVSLWFLSVVARAGLWILEEFIFEGGRVDTREVRFVASEHKLSGAQCEAKSAQNAARITLDVLAYALSSGVCAAVGLHILYVLGALKFSRNHFVGKVVGMTDYDGAIRDWNMIQALFCELSSSVEVLFTCHVASIALAMFFYFREISVETILVSTSTHVLVPLIFASILAIALLMSAERLTIACMHAPSVINSLLPKGAKVMDPKRHYLVEYVKYSDPGFRIFGRLITAQTLMNVLIPIAIAGLYLVSVNLWLRQGIVLTELGSP